MEVSNVGVAVEVSNVVVLVVGVVVIVSASEGDDSFEMKSYNF